METIIGLLIVILPMAFKLIGKVLEDASEAPPKGPVPGRARSARPQHGIDGDFENPVSKPRREPIRPSIVDQICQEGEPSVEVQQNEVVLHQDCPVKKKQKIDPKKLVLYSEIMKPKY